MTDAATRSDPAFLGEMVVTFHLVNGRDLTFRIPLPSDTKAAYELVSIHLDAIRDAFNGGTHLPLVSKPMAVFRMDAVAGVSYQLEGNAEVEKGMTQSMPKQMGFAAKRG